MKNFFLILTFFATVSSFAQRTIPHITIKSIEARMTDLKSSLFLTDSLYQEYLNGSWLTIQIQDGSKSDLYESGSSWLYNHYTALGKEYPKQCSECKTKADELARLMDKELRDAAETAYRNLIQKADEYFAQRNFLKAKELYQRAVHFMPSDPYPKNRLKEVETILTEKEKQ